MDYSHLIEQLPASQRLALAYATRRSRLPFLALFSLDQRLGTIVRSMREPMLAQMRLAWWREQLQRPSNGRAAGEPVLAALGECGLEVGGLVALADGWEELLGETPLLDKSFQALCTGRAAACSALATRLGLDPQQAALAGEGWAWGDLQQHLSNPAERAQVQVLARQSNWNNPRLERDLRPLLILHGLAKRSIVGMKSPDRPGALLAAIRLGLFGR